jgi:hypothetical protein
VGEFWTTDAPAAKFLTNFAPPGDNFAHPPRRNSDNFASPPHSNWQPANDLQRAREAKFAEFRLTKKRKNISGAKIKNLNRKPLDHGAWNACIQIATDAQYP